VWGSRVEYQQGGNGKRERDRPAFQPHQTHWSYSGCPKSCRMRINEEPNGALIYFRKRKIRVRVTARHRSSNSLLPGAPVTGKPSAAWSVTAGHSETVC
jgi:hypothetical protein